MMRRDSEPLMRRDSDQMLRGRKGAARRRPDPRIRSVTLRGDEGSTLPLILVFFAIAAGLIVVSAGATALHLERLRLLTVADGASLAGAESFELDDVRVDGDHVTPALHASQIESAVHTYLEGADTRRLDGFRVVHATTADGHSATVVLTAIWHPPIAGDLLPVAVPVTVTSTASARFR